MANISYPQLVHNIGVAIKEKAGLDSLKYGEMEEVIRSMGGGLIPSTYQQVEYIESTGTQYIDTDIKTKDIYSVLLDLQFSDISTDQRNGAYLFESNIVKSLFLGVTQSKFYMSCGANYPNEFNYSASSATTERVRLGVNIPDHNMFLEQNDNRFFKSRKKRCLFEFLLFATNFTNGAGSFCKEKIYSARFYDALGGLIGDFAPCYKKSNNEIGLYDTVSKTFFANQGTGTFIKGEDV